MRRIEINGVPVDAVTLEEAVERILSLLRDLGKHHVMTPNPEMVVEAQRNPQFLSVLRRASLAIPDGTGLLWAVRRLGFSIRDRVTGTDVLIALSRRTNAPSLFLLGAGEGVAERAATQLQATNSHLRIAGTFSGSPHPSDEGGIVERINRSGAEMLVVAYGAPAQELWIDRNLSALTTVRVAMGVGGAFDYIAGERSRAPRFLQSIGLEWLWRLVHEPRRIRRIWNAVVVFPWKVLTGGTGGKKREEGEEGA